MESFSNLKPESKNKDNFDELLMKLSLVDNLNKKIKSDEDLKTSNIIPILLVDNSGSTSTIFTAANKTILNYEMNVAKITMEKMGYQMCHLMFWGSMNKIIEYTVKTNELHQIIAREKISSSGGTDISIAINSIPELWYDNDVPIYILTDGAVNADKYGFRNQIFNLAKRKVNIHIITVENNNYDYMISNVEAGSNIYSTIQSNKLSKYIRSFECYNCFHFDSPFINFYSPQIEKGQFSFKEFIFDNKDFMKFSEIISSMIDYYSKDKKMLDKIIYHLSFTLYEYLKPSVISSMKIRNEIIKMFVGLFEGVYDDIEYVKNTFESEIISHEEGASKTFHQYKENRKKLFEKTQDELYLGVQECFGKGNMFMSFPIQMKDKKIKIIQSDKMNTVVKLGNLSFANGGITYGDYIFPMLSVDTKNSESAEQALRQWIRAVYSRIHNIQINDEKILYLFLTDMLSIVLNKDLPQEIKSGYKNCAKVMLNANRFNSGGIKQITWLTMGNKPKPMIPGYSSINEILTECMNYFNPTLIGNMTVDDFWYGICIGYGMEELVKKQIPPSYDALSLMEKLFLHNKKYTFENIKCAELLDYGDYISMEDVSETGGYKFPDYTIGKKTFVSKFVISEKSYQYLKSQSTDGTTLCPITSNKIKLDKFEKVLPKKSSQNNLVVSSDYSEIDMKIFNMNNYERVDVKILDKMKLTDLELKNSSQYDFTNYPYEFVGSIPIITEKLYKERVQYRTSEEFSKQIDLRYEWLKNLDMNGVAIAGGFCKSLILDEKVNDIDMYLYGLGLEPNLEPDSNAEADKKDEALTNLYSNRLSKLVGDLTRLISTKYPKSVSLQAYKKEFNVYEIIYFENIKDLEKQKFELEDLTQMKYITKIQIIMKKHNAKSDIFNTFDLDSSCVLWDGKELLFNDRSYYAYKYMINIPRIDNFYTDIFDMRLIKYYNSGFRIVLPRLSIKELQQKLIDSKKQKEENDKLNLNPKKKSDKEIECIGTITINKSKFYVSSIDQTNVFINKAESIIIKEPKITKNESGKNSNTENKQTSVYNTIIGDLGSLNDSRSIVKFMKYVRRQNKIVDKVRKNIVDGVKTNDEQLLNEINDEMKTELKELGFINKKNVKQRAYISDDENENESLNLKPESDEEEEEEEESKKKASSHNSTDKKICSKEKRVYSKDKRNGIDYSDSEEEEEEPEPKKFKTSSNNSTDKKIYSKDKRNGIDCSDSEEDEKEPETYKSLSVSNNKKVCSEKEFKFASKSNYKSDEEPEPEKKCTVSPTKKSDIIIGYINMQNNVEDKINFGKDKKVDETNKLNSSDEFTKVEQISEINNNIEDTASEEKKPEDYIKVYYKVCDSNSTLKINEFDNGTCELNFIWDYTDFHTQMDWYSRDQEKEQINREKLEREKKEEKEDEDEDEDEDEEEIEIKLVNPKK